MNRRAEKQIKEIFQAVWKKIVDEQRLKAIMSGDFTSVRVRVRLLSHSTDYAKFAKEFAVKLARIGLNQEKGLWRKYFEAAKKANYIALTSKYTEFEQKQFEKAVSNNFKMIKSIPNEVLKTVKEKGVKKLIREIATGSEPKGSFKRFLVEKGVKRAELIARTETAKLQTIITQNRATDLGSVCYQWVSSHDRRTRPSHRDMNGVIVFWRNKDGEKPLLDKMNGNAGEFPNCRCTTKVIFDERDLNLASYKVYDYRTHSILTMPKAMLVAALKNGEL